MVTDPKIRQHILALAKKCELSDDANAIELGELVRAHLGTLSPPTAGEVFMVVRQLRARKWLADDPGGLLDMKAVDLLERLTREDGAGEECQECDGNGLIWNNADPTSGQRVDCPKCCAEGGAR